LIVSDAILERRRAAIQEIQREALVEGFAAAVAQKGYARATIGDIVGAAHVSKSTFYEHFADKEAVYLHLHATVAVGLSAALAETLNRTAAETDPRTRLGALVSTYLQAMADNPMWLTQVRIEPQVATPGALTARVAARKAFEQMLIALSEDLAGACNEVAALTGAIIEPGLAGMVSLVADAAADGPQAVRSLEQPLTEFWVRLHLAAP